ncbi:heat-shock protein Hsp20 [Paenibacillus tyrfis]|uniref:Hsp20/alpha crystallin family protein n=1 Tax=Paenibacillus TaxID=44249 RepID=UPI0024920037|nr:Hsp20/alpha crystallin family protein [Paenibacillus tyrfis]GLI07950.1 heat-shock protein Hsp20 [Paenibacillus tyrfis]GMX60409.1 Hsp20/alpha crystallin family protein [Paenibacillus elgii]
MPLVPFEPFRRVDHWKKEMDKFFNEGLPSAFGFQQEFGAPRMDVYETESEVIAHCEIPGLEKKEDVDIQVEQQTLTIVGTVHKVHEAKEEQFHRKERYSGRFQRTVALPAEVQAEGTVATYKNGILEVKMPKVQNSARKRIDVEFH